MPSAYSLTRRLLHRVSLAALALGLMSAGFTMELRAAESGEPTGKAEYVKFHPDFVVNLKTPEPHFLMVTVQGMSRGTEGIAAAKHHMAAIRHHILMLLSEQTLETIGSSESKQALMDQALAGIQELMIAETGKASIEAVLFTDFVVE